MQNSIDSNKITVGIISELAKNVASFVIQKIKKNYKDFNSKNDIDYKNAFEKYLKESNKHISKSKTVLYGRTPHNLYSFFECMNIKSAKNKIIDTSNVNNVLSIGNKIIITGTGGIGKSMLMRHCFLNTIINTNYIPVLVELRGLNEFEINDIHLEDYIYKALNIFGFKLEEEYFQYSLDTVCYVILLDGYDEVKNAISQKVTNEIIDFSNRYPNNHLILSSRPLDEFIGWSDFIEYSAIPLNKHQALSLISKLDYDAELKKKFCTQLDKELYQKYKSFASNPLLLTIMLMTFESRVSIPDNRVDFYEQAFSTLFHRHDAMKKGRFKREIASKLSYEDFKKVFSYFCFRSFFKNQYEFSEQSVLENISKAKEKYPINIFESKNYLNDLTKAVCVLIHEGLNYRFTHRSFQEYFAVLYTIQLNDDEQKKFISSWLKSIDGRLTTDFLNILCDLQPERFLKNILYDAIYELYNMYTGHGKSNSWFIEYMCSAIFIFDNENMKDYVLISTNESYYSVIFDYMLRYLHYDQRHRDKNIKNADQYSGIINILKQKYPHMINRGIAIKKLNDDGLYTLIEPLFDSFIASKDFVFQKIDSINIDKLSNKKILN